MSDAPCDMASLVDELLDNIVLYNIFPCIETNVSNTYMKMYLLCENVIGFKSLIAHNKFWLHLLNSTIVGAILRITLQNVKGEGYEDT